MHADPHPAGSSRIRAAYRNFLAHIAPGLPAPVLYAGAVGLFAIAFFYFTEQHLRDACCDAKNYVKIATAYSTSGMDQVPQAVRTFAYPWILSSVQRISSFLDVPFKLSVFLVQLAVYYSAVLAVSNHLRKSSPELGSSVYLLLCFNVYLIPYIGLTLTDAIYTSIAVWVLLLTIQVSLPGTSADGAPRPGSKILFACVFLASLAIVIRPAAIWLVGPLVYCVVNSATGRGPRYFPALAAIILLGAIPLYVQIYLNVLHFGVVSFLPTGDLGKSQVVWGIENIKYATWLGGGSPRNYYSSAHLVDLSGDHSTLAWYLANPADAFKLVLFKLVGAFDFDYLTPYPVESPYFRWAPTLVSASIAWFGLCGVAYHLLTAKLRCLGSRFVPAVFLLSWTVVTIPSALELRFSLPMLCLFIVTAAAFVDVSLKENKRALMIAAGAWVVLAPLYIAAAAFVRNQSILAAGLQ